jgi:tRNA A-37 threonylcarbamoyl transferase component Bud32
MKFSVFNVKDKESQPFLVLKNDKRAQNSSLNRILVDHKPSLVASLNESDFIIKFVKARSWHEYMKLLWNHSRITKEIKGTSILQKLGLNVPEIYEVGYGIIPSLKYEYLGYYIMENLTHSGFQELSALIKDGAIDDTMRSKIMLAVHDGLKKMHDNRAVFSDFHLDNIFSNDDGEITWIDAGVTTYNRMNEKKFIKKFNYSITRYMFYCNDRGNTLSQKETDLFNTLLIRK